MQTRMRYFMVALSLTISSQAFAFGGSKDYRDPPSQIGRFFTDAARADRSPPHWTGYSPAELQARWIEFQKKVLAPDPEKKCSTWQECDLTVVRHWLDWVLWFRLNLEAAELWESLVACAENQDPERARIAYYHAQSFCPRDARMDEELGSRLFSLHGRVRDFLISTNVEWANRSSARDLIRTLRTIIPVHPLFAQVFTEYVATVVRFSRQRLDQGESNWIEPRYGREFGDRVNAILRGKAEAISERFQHARTFANVHLILSFFPNTTPNVPGWGLWREGSALLAALISQQMTASHRLTEVAWDVSWLTFEVRNPLSTEDGAAPNTLLSGLLLDHEASLVTEYRALAERYGLPTDRHRLCRFSPPLCFARDPSNPDERMEGL